MGLLCGIAVFFDLLVPFVNINIVGKNPANVDCKPLVVLPLLAEMLKCISSCSDFRLQSSCRVVIKYSASYTTGERSKLR